MKNISLLVGILLNGLLIISCNNKNSNESATAANNPVVQTDTVKFTAAMIDNKKDPSCGMPLTDDIEDTVHYKDKVLGFCSKECKDEFLKAPEKNIAAADMKK
jgi:YHS domain-containing protein